MSLLRSVYSPSVKQKTRGQRTSASPYSLCPPLSPRDWARGGSRVRLAERNGRDPAPLVKRAAELAASSAGSSAPSRSLVTPIALASPPMPRPTNASSRKRLGVPTDDPQISAAARSPRLNSKKSIGTFAAPTAVLSGGAVAKTSLRQYGHYGHDSYRRDNAGINAR